VVEKKANVPLEPGSDVVVARLLERHGAAACSRRGMVSRIVGQFLSFGNNQLSDTGNGLYELTRFRDKI
jgi:hypothetical protein